MTLRLAGEEFSVVQGLDGEGYLRTIEAGDASPGLLVNQKGAGDILQLQDSGVARLVMKDGGNVLLANTAGPPSSPDSLLHLWAGSAGAVSPQINTLLTLEGDTNTFITLLGPTAGQVGIAFGDANNATAGWFNYEHNNTRYAIGIEGTARLHYSAGAFAFQEATAISTTAGDLTLDPADDIILGTGNTQVRTIRKNTQNVSTDNSISDSMGTLGAMFIVSGVDTTGGKKFVDLVLAGRESTPTVVASQDIVGTVDARIYAGNADRSLHLAMAANTYDITVLHIQMPQAT